MRSPYFTNKHYLTKDNRRIAHVHIVGDAYTVCGHYKRFTEFKRRTFNKYEFEQFCRDRGLSIEEWLPMKIKTKKQLNLPQLLEWAWDNPKSSRNKRFVSENKEFPYVNQYVIFNEVGYAEIENSYCYGRNDLFTVEVEEEITEDTEIPKLMTTFKKTCLEGGIGYQRVRIDENYPIKLMLNKAEAHGEPVETLHVVNDDDTHTLIWRDGRLIE